MKDDQDEYFVECFGGYIGTWYFISRLRGLTEAVELAAVFRRIKDAPTRVVRVDARPPRAGVSVSICTGRE